MTTGNEGGDPKEKADVPPVLPSEQQSSGDAKGALSPDDLDFTESPYVDEIDEGRYVVSADRTPPNVPDKQGSSQSLPQAKTQSQSQAPATRSNASGETAPATDAGPESAPAAADPRGTANGIQSPEAARTLLANELERVDTRFAIDIVSRFGEDTVRHRMTSDDVVGTFNSLVFWYARHVSRNTPTNRAASLLLAKSDFTPELTETQVRTAMAKHGLDESSSLEELLEALE
ncbi:DUF7500 family protein [Halopiger xanaduensis]|uniref:Flagella cluster protein n=1 Tax=Halopiger xanaduensis (strain DSM 18323 / JCM 14033 / SH-6) TaxID=797210 RepID=F8DA61_HALXS|nr:hypothetical protein [Halopiger xanaduensis]AEH38133.1 flagella cluster protein [Halopiger xanaduensis SH-6]